MPGFPPTPEQQAIYDAVRAGKNAVVAAGAGSGKTSTMLGVAEDNRGKKVLYVAYNSVTKQEAEGRFPGNTTCKTSHGLAWGWAARRYGGFEGVRARMNTGRVTPHRTAGILGIRDPLRYADDRAPLAPGQVATLAMKALTRWCYSADAELGRQHVPSLSNIAMTHGIRSTLADVVLPAARRAWTDLMDPEGYLRLAHDHYLKAWALTDPTLPYDLILFDEAQDANAVIAATIDRQNTQKVFVGDSNQAIYEWRGAVDALATFQADVRLTLTKSFRFGPAIADAANDWLTVLGSDMRLTGHDPIQSRVGTVESPDAVLCRTNGAAVAHMMTAQEKGRRVALVDKTAADIKRFAFGARELIVHNTSTHHDLIGFDSWHMVQDYVDEAHDGGDLAVFVKLIDKHGVERIISAVERCVPENRADVTISTMHKSKGREWGSVLIADDVKEPKDERGHLTLPDPQDSRLYYVAVTRAMQQLDRGGLAFVDRLLPHKAASDASWAAAAPQLTGAEIARAALAASKPALCGAPRRGYANVTCTQTAGHFPTTQHQADVFGPYGDDQVAVPA